MRNALQAAHLVGLEFRGGISALAQAIGRNVQVMINKLNVNNTTHHLTLQEAELMTAVSGRSDIADALLAPIGRISIAVPQMRECDDQAMLDLSSRLMQEQGEFFAEFSKRYADGEISKKDLNVLLKESGEVIQVMLEIQERIKKMAGV